jgi:hypothetical protein
MCVSPRLLVGSVAAVGYLSAFFWLGYWLHR